MNLTKNFLLILLSSLFALFVLEYGSYLILYILKNNNLNISGQVALGRAIEEETPSLSTVIPHPYSLYWNNPNFTDAVYGKQFNSLGHRSIEFKDLPTNAYKILVLGGSTTNMWPFVKDRNKIWTSLLENKLSKKYGTDIAVINAGLPYGTSSELMIHFLLVEKYLRPDLVIYHDSGNDIMPLMFPNYKTDYSHVRWSSSGLAMRSFFKSALRKSSFFKLIYSVIFKGDIDVNNGNPPWSILNPTEVHNRVLHTQPIAFKSNLNVITTEATRQGAKVLLVGFLQARKENLSRNKPEFIGYEDVFILGKNKHDDVMRQISTESKKYLFYKS